MTIKTLVYTLVGVALLVGIVSVLNYSPCNKLTEMDLSSMKIECYTDILDQLQTNPELILDETCEFLGREAGCQFTEADQDGITAYLNKKINTCVDKKLVAGKFCKKVSND